MMIRVSLAHGLVVACLLDLTATYFFPSLLVLHNRVKKGDFTCFSGTRLDDGFFHV
jgi:hypothetical protein